MSKYQPTISSLTSIRDDGSRRFLYPADVKGAYTTRRMIFFAILIAVYALLPWIQINGQPAVFLDAASRRFHLFGMTFVAQDFWLVFFIITGLAFSLFFVTALLGRIWCGYACPQTVFLEGVFRRIERWIEGDAVKRERLAKAPWTPDKITRRVIKHGLYLAIALVIAHLFIAYFVSLPALYAMVRSSPLANTGVFVWMLILTGILYFNFSWFREQLCIIICPYGRLQSALIDDDSLIIGYDEQRGEPRGKATDPNAGHCIDCRRCVDVCPTGIDIRHGLQMECIGCAACIDACDTIMERLKRPRGLIRYDSLNGLAGKGKRILRPRIILYTILFFIGVTVFSLSLRTVQPYTFSAIRMGGGPYFIEETAIRNHFQLRFINKRTETMTLPVTVSGGDFAINYRLPENPVVLAPGEERIVPLFVTLPREHFQGMFSLTVTTGQENGRTTRRRLQFLGPDLPPSLP